MISNNPPLSERVNVFQCRLAVMWLLSQARDERSREERADSGHVQSIEQPESSCYSRSQECLFPRHTGFISWKQQHQAFCSNIKHLKGTHENLVSR